MAIVEHSLLRLGPSSAGLLMTPEEFDAITDYDESCCYELIRGVLVVTPFASEAERDPNEELGFLLRTYRKNHPQGASLDNTLFGQYIRTPISRRRADRAIWAGLARHPDPLLDVPTIVVEFPSAGKATWRRDHIEKRDEYLSIGVLEYWVIDRFQRTMTVYSSESGHAKEQRIAANDTYRTPLLPGFELPLAELISRADRW